MITRHQSLTIRFRVGIGIAFWFLSVAAIADATNQLTGFYYGTATINSPANIGIVDLAFYFDVTGSAIQQTSSYIDLDKTLLFPEVAPPINGKAVGPRVSGSLSASVFSLDSQTFTSESGGKTVTRRIKLDNATVGSGGAAIAGNYTETVEGMMPEALVISGTFRLMKPLATILASGQDGNGDGCLSLSEIRAGGADPDTVEFSDISAAMNLYNHPVANLKLGDPPGPSCSNGEQTLQQAINAFYGSSR